MRTSSLLEPSKQVPKTHLMSEEEWRRAGVQQSLGWVHYTIHKPESQTVLLNNLFQKSTKISTSGDR
uniref:Cyclin-dependent kinases regulatory subunit n=1 Tax=Ursus americanus TaxID=9643 RepID=A0A452QX48_URSAM